MVRVLEFLRNGNTLEKLEELYGIKNKRHNKFPNLVLLKYNQIDSPMGERIVQECRGLILNEEGNWDVVCRPFDKFFNAGEGHAATIDWNTAEVQEKLDGSLITMYHYDWKDEKGDQGWKVSTSGMPDASGEVNDTGITFEKLFWDTFFDMGGMEPHCSVMFEDYNICIMFELMTPWNRIVVPHKEASLRVIGCRNRATGQEYPASYGASLCCIPAVKSFPLVSLDNIIDTFENMDPLKQEGYVVVDGNFNRIKVKHPGYVALHHTVSSLSVKTILEIVRSGETEELLVHFPEWEKVLTEVKESYDRFSLQLRKYYEEIADIEDRKTFAMLAQKCALPGIMFQLKDKKIVHVREGLANIHIKKLITLLGLDKYVVPSSI